MAAAAFINKIGCAVPRHDVNHKFVSFAPLLLENDHDRKLFIRMAKRAQIDHRYSVLTPNADPAELDSEGFYRRGKFPDTALRMDRYDSEALPLASRALAELGLDPKELKISHLIITSCTGFVAPGLDLQLAAHLDLAPTVERTIVGFMGCSATIPALKLARHIVRSDGNARVLVVALELCTLHLQENSRLEEILSYLLFADGCAAALVSQEPYGIEIMDFSSAVLPGTSDYITWRLGGSGFEMRLSGEVPAAILAHLPGTLPSLLAGTERQNVTLWAIHPGGRTILDAVEKSLGTPLDAFSCSRRILRDYGNMSSATVMFVLREMIDRRNEGTGCAMAFGPGVAVEAMTFLATG
jgi:alpha-pyrone synthase